MPHDDHHHRDHHDHDDHHAHKHGHSDIEMVGNVGQKNGNHHGHGSHGHAEDHDDHDHHAHHDDHDDFEEDLKDHQSLLQRDPPKPKENLNLRAAYLHVLGDLVQSIAVLIAGVVIMYEPTWSVIDPILSIIFCPLIFYSTIGIIRTSLRILLEGTPPEVKTNELWSSIASVEGVTKVTNLQVWSISHGTIAMTVHARAMRPQSALHKINDICTQRYVQ